MDPIEKARRETGPDPIQDALAEDRMRRAGKYPNPDTERAQPGDVVGIETEGETTHLGETAEDEDERRRDAEKKAR
jgi:hypothetical protein